MRVHYWRKAADFPSWRSYPVYMFILCPFTCENLGACDFCTVKPFELHFLYENLLYKYSLLFVFLFLSFWPGWKSNSQHWRDANMVSSYAEGLQSVWSSRSSSSMLLARLRQRSDWLNILIRTSSPQLVS